MSSTQEVGEIFGEGSGPAHAMLRSPTVLIASVGLWGLNILIFRIFRINYVTVLKYDLKKIRASELEEEGGGGGGDDDNNDNDSQLTASSGGGGGGGGSGSKASSSSLHVKKLSEGSLPPMATSMSGDSKESDDDNNNKNMNGGGGIVDHTMNPLDSSPTGIPLDDAITWNRLVSFSASLLFLLHFTTFIWMEVLGGGFIGAIFSFYGSVIIVVVLPIPSLQWLRKGFTICFQRCFELINPRCHCLSNDWTKVPRPIPFVDVYFADAMCSLSKVFFDMGMLLHMLSHYPEPVPPSMHNILIPSACAAVPYLIRARQCLVMYTVGRMQNDPKRGQHIANAVKYSTSLWPLFLSAYQKTIDPVKAEELESLLLVLLTVNASYSLYWDIVMDWGMMHSTLPVAGTGCLSVYCGGGGIVPPGAAEGGAVAEKKNCTQGLLRPRLRFGLWTSAAILFTDSILRFSWTLRFCNDIFPSPDAFVLCTQFLEVFRRAIWNLLRVEWENIKQQKAQVEKEIQSDDDEDEEEHMPFISPAALPMTVPAKRPNSANSNSSPS